jgi:Na+/phosphate symporter
VLAQYWVAETTRNTDLAKTLQRDEDKIDSFNSNISDYLSKISEGMRILSGNSRYSVSPMIWRA